VTGPVSTSSVSSGAVSTGPGLADQASAVESAIELPTVRIVRGSPTCEELAAVIAVISQHACTSAAGPASAPTTATAASSWTDRSRYLRGDHPHRPGGWRAAAFPR
jgi:hypothetical protein